MASERRFLLAASLVLLVGLGIMLYGVFLSSGQSVNTLMIVGSIVVVLPFAVMVYWTARLEDPAGESHT
jgi:hypothetical protein